MTTARSARFTRTETDRTGGFRYLEGGNTSTWLIGLVNKGLYDPST